MEFDPPPDIAPATPEPLVLTAAGRIVRKKRLTWKLLQILPEPPAPVKNAELPDFDPDATPPPTSTAFEWQGVLSSKNSFGLYREYPTVPTHNPDDVLTLADLSDNTPPVAVTDEPPLTSSRLAPVVPDSPSVDMWKPFANSSISGLMNWIWSGSPMKSIGEMTKLVQFLKSDDFRKEDIVDFDVKQETAAFDKYLETSGDTGADASASSGIPRSNDAWREVNVNIQIPDRQPHSSFDDVPVFTVPGLHFCPIIEVIKSVFNDSSSRCFHYTPFKHFWAPSAPPDNPESPPQRISDEIYSSQAMINAHIELQKRPPEAGCTLERVVAALMFWSDSTHLANFGNASLWPLYLFFGNQSKWLRGKPRTASCHHVAYIPKVYFSNPSILRL